MVWSWSLDETRRPRPIYGCRAIGEKSVISDVITIIVATGAILFIIIAWIAIHLGRNPRNGGKPPSDSSDVNIMNFVSVASLFVIRIWLINVFFSMARQPLRGLGRLIFRGFTITHFRHTTLGRTPLNEGPARHRDLYLTTHNTHKRQTSMS
jgi:hypothetical protein